MVLEGKDKAGEGEGVERVLEHTVKLLGETLLYLVVKYPAA